MHKQREAVVIGAYLALAVLATHPLALRAGSAIPMGGDSWANYWNLWWVKTALLERGVSPYVTPDLHFPYGTTLYFHTLNLLGGIVSLPIVSALGVPAGYNFLVLLSFVLSGYGTYRLVLYVLTRQSPTMEPGRALQLGAFVAGVAFTFSSYRYAHLLGHLDLVSTQWLPFSMLFLLQARDEPGWRNLERLEERGSDGRSLRWRWMGERARLGAIAAEPVPVRLAFVAQAFGRVRRLQLVANSTSIVTMPIGPDRAAYETPTFLLTPDVQFIELRSLDGADSPGVDQRPLSIALYRLEMVAG